MPAKTESACLAQENWRNKKGVKEEQKEKDRLRKAKKREEQRAEREAAREAARLLDSSTHSEPTYQNLTTQTGAGREVFNSESHVHQKPSTHGKRRKRSSSLPPTLPDPTPSLDPDRHDDSIAIRIRNIRFRYLNWTYDWGPANLWERKFNKLLHEARRISQVDVDELFEELDKHACKGRDILKELKYVGAGACTGEYGVFIDLFVQGFEMAVDITSEVKFFEVKLDECAPCLPTVIESEICFMSD